MIAGAAWKADAQTTRDFAYRQNIAVSWEATKNTDLTLRYRTEVFDNATRFRRSLFSFTAAQEVVNNLKIGGEYRFYTSYEMDFHRFQAYIRYTYKVNKKIAFNYRIQYQQKQDYFDEEYLLFNPPARVWRNRLLGRYNYSKKLEFYGYAELFHRLKYEELSPYRMRYGLGLEYMLKKRHALNLELFANDEFNLKRPEDVLTFDVGYQYLIKRKKKGKGKKPPSATELK